MSRSQRNSRRQDLDRGVRQEADVSWGVSGDEAGIVPLFQLFMLFDLRMVRSTTTPADHLLSHTFFLLVLLLQI